MNTSHRLNQSALPHAITPITGNDLDRWFDEQSDEKCESRKKELEVFLGCCRDPRFIHDKTVIFCSPEHGRPEFREWFRTKTTQRSIIRFLLGNDHKVNGKWGNWSNGGFGSRWCDVRLNGYDVRLAYYSKATNPVMFNEDAPKRVQEMSHMIMLLDYFEGKDCDGEHPTAF